MRIAIKAFLRLVMRMMGIENKSHFPSASGDICCGKGFQKDIRSKQMYSLIAELFTFSSLSTR